MTSSSEDPVFVGLDQKFDKVLAEMKPHVLKLPHKTGRYGVSFNTVFNGIYISKCNHAWVIWLLNVYASIVLL